MLSRFCVLFHFILFISCVFVFSGCSNAENFAVSENSKTDYSIVLCAEAYPAEKYAAEELGKYLKQITGVEFPVIDEKEATSENKKCFYVGYGNLAAKVFPEFKTVKFDKDQIIVKSNDGAILLAGDRPRGALYSVYTFLENICGCRWWTPDEETIPNTPDLSVPKLNYTFSPPFCDMRICYSGEAIVRPEFAVKMKARPPLYEFPEKFGGKVAMIPSYHTFFKLLPPKKYFAAHPEWYSLVDGKRINNGQLCLINDEMLKELVENCRKLLKDSPEAVLMITQQDVQARSCQCEKCKAIEDKEGPSGVLLQFVNKAAKLLEPEFPKARIATFAYMYTEAPPKTIKPRDNVLIFFCAYMGTYWHPLDSRQNASTRDHLKKWSSMSKHMFVWNYRTNFYNYLSLNPNLNTVDKDLQFFVREKATGVHFQGDRFCNIGDFIRMRTWVGGHLLWNPYLKAEVLRKEFLNGYYGKAAPYLEKYLEGINRSSLGQRGKRITISAEPLLQGARDYNEALEAVKDDPELYEKVWRERASLLQTALALAVADRRVGMPVITELGFESLDAAIDSLDALGKKYKTWRYQEGGPECLFSDRIDFLRKMAAIPVAEEPEIKGVNLKRVKWFDFQENSIYRLVSPPAKTMEDKDASNGMAFWMPGGHNGWNVRYGLEDFLKDNRFRSGTFLIRAKLKLKGTPPKDGIAFQYGIYSLERKTGFSKDVKFGDIKSGDEYQYFKIKLGRRFAKPGYIWMNSIGDKKYLDHILFDRVVFVNK